MGRVHGDCHPSFIMPASVVPESVLKKRKTQEKIAADKTAAAAEAKKVSKEKRVAAYKSAERYVKEYRSLAKQRVRMHRQAKAAGNHYVDAGAKLAFVVRIRGLNDMHPKTKKILQIMRLRQMNLGVFMKISKASTEMYKRVFGKINHQRVPLNDNSVVEAGLGKYGIMCMEDLIHEIYTVGPHFREANNFLWPFKLRPAKGGQAKKRKGFCEGGQAGNREEKMNKLIANML